MNISVLMFSIQTEEISTSMQYGPRFYLIGGIITAFFFGSLFLNRSCSDTQNKSQSDAVNAQPTQDTAYHISLSDTVEWHRPRYPERKEERHQMVEEGIYGQGINDQKVLQAMRHVPRHLFVPKSWQSWAYANRPLPIGHDQTISQPYIVAFMTEQLELEAGEKVLEIGTGSGYQAAVLSELTPEVYTIEIVEPLGRQARERFDRLGYHTIKVKIGDGYKGWPDYAPFHAIILTAAAEEIPPPLIEQLAAGGVLVMPKGKEGQSQVLLKITKTEDGELRQRQLLPVRFVPMTGEIQN